MSHTSIPLDSPIEFINIDPSEHSPLISKCQIKVCYVGDEVNRNGSIITKEVATKMAPSLRGAMIVGHYNEEIKDFEEHNKIIEVKNGKYVIKNDTEPYGFVDLNAPVWFQKFLDDNQVEREYLVTEGYLWTGQLPECKRILEKGNNQSMELDNTLTRGTWTNFNNSKMKFFIINEAIISKLCILGEECEPCFEGSNITNTQFSLNEIEFKEKIFSLMEEMKEILSKGGAAKMNNLDNIIEEVNVEEETPVNEFSENEVNEVQDETSENEVITEEEVSVTEEIQEENVASYVLEEIPEYVEATSRIGTLEAEYSELQKNYNSIMEELTVLREFKNKADRAEKESMINSFYMLSDEDKADVVENIDSYSLDEIESKLSIICVRNKVSFAKEEEEKATPMTYRIEDSVDTTPSWIKAVLDTAKEML